MLVDMSGGDYMLQQHMSLGYDTSANPQEHLMIQATNNTPLEGYSTEVLETAEPRKYTSSEHASAIKYKYWTPEEDEKLLNVIKQHGTMSWGFIASFMEGRSMRACQDHYHMVLAPKERIANASAMESEGHA